LFIENRPVVIAQLWFKVSPPNLAVWQLLGYQVICNCMAIKWRFPACDSKCFLGVRVNQMEMPYSESDNTAVY